MARHAPCLPVVSFDDAKAELGLRHGENDGMAAHHAVHKTRHQSFRVFVGEKLVAEASGY